MPDNIEEYLALLVNLKQNNLLNRVLISHDAGWYDVINPQSVTYRGYTDFLSISNRHCWIGDLPGMNGHC